MKSGTWKPITENKSIYDMTSEDAKQCFGNAFSFDEVIENAKKAYETEKKAFEENGGICLHCGKNPGDSGGLNEFHCKKCNSETEKIIEKLRRGGGFAIFQITKRGK